jgi:ATP/maltotriose-dependent transcriptional regulator MalT
MAVAGRLVGRAEELRTLDLILDELDRGAAAAIEVLGEPGIGKTRMLAELCELAESRGHLVLSGSASELERDVPFSAFVDALDEYVQSVEPERLAPLGDEVRAELRQVLPSLPLVAPPPDTPLGHERYRTHRAVRSLFERLAASRPLVLVLDDLHWADPGSLELVGALLRRPPAAPVLLALAVRPRQMPERLGAALERAHRDESLMRLELGALTAHEVRELLGDDGARAIAVYEETGGNPFYVTELARSRDRASGATLSGASIVLDGVEVPTVVAAALSEELSLLGGESRMVLEGAAVAGDPFEPELAAAAAGTSENSAIAALDELLRQDLVRPTDVPRRFRFRHPLVRRAVYEAAPAGWRLGAHERCSELLRARGASAAARAHHIELSGRFGDEEAVATLRAAGEEALHHAPASAAHWFSVALRLLPDSAPANARLELLEARAGALAAAGRLQDSRAVYEECLRIAPEHGADAHLSLTVACARVEHLLGLHADARVRLERALAEVPDPDSVEAATLMIQLAVERWHSFDMDGAREWASRALEPAAAQSDSAVVAEALALRALAAAMAGLAESAQEDIDKASRLEDQLSDDQLSTRLDAASNLAFAEWQVGRVEPAVRHAERTFAVARTTGHGDLPVALVSILCAGLRVRGRLVEALEVGEGAVESARLLDNAHALAWSLTLVADAAFAAGDMEHALEAGQEAADVSEGLDASLFMPSAAAVALAAPLLEIGEAKRAAELMSTFAGGEGPTTIPMGARSRALELTTRCLLAAGERARAEEAAAAAAECAKAVPLPIPAAMAKLAAASLELDAGDARTASDLALDAATLLDEIGRILDATFARLLSGRALARAGENDDAAAVLDQAAREFESYGSERFRNQAEQELRRLGRTVYRRTARGSADGGLASLTERELELARLVVDRKTNPEIAAELFLSQKTVETHLRNIFRKVGVTNRVELARAVEEWQRSGKATT